MFLAEKVFKFLYPHPNLNSLLETKLVHVIKGQARQATGSNSKVVRSQLHLVRQFLRTWSIVTFEQEKLGVSG